jgi:hypothetical protein
MRTLIVGDIHGCYDELLHLVARADLGPDDRIVSVGDLVDRGPKSYEVVRYFASDPERRLAVLGNHEEKHVRGTRPDASDPSGRIVRRSISPEQYAEMIDYMRKLPLYLDLPEVLVVHAGLAPGLDIDQQAPATLTGRGSQGRDGFDGASTPWYDDPRFAWPKPVVFGHMVSARVVRGKRANVWGLDTGAAVGGALTGLLLPEGSLMSEATLDYYAQALRRWRPVFLAEDLPELPWKAVLALVPSDWSPALATRIQAAQAMYRTTMERLSAETASLIASTGWSSLSPESKARTARALREDARFSVDDMARLRLRCFPAGPTDQLLQKAFPTPDALERALSNGPAMPEILAARTEVTRG